jgi:uncharacterized protein (DUF2235 family)
MKRIVVCCDGTWNRPDQVHGRQVCASNVTKIARCIAPVDSAGNRQLVFYDKGVGTGHLDRIRGGAFGWGIRKKILDAYSFLVTMYDPGDELFFLGFSRGAYTVRSTFGLIRNSGLLKREFAYKIDDAYALYRRRDDASRPDAVESELFRRSYGWEPRAKFIGVWDTVGSLGVPVGGLFQFINKRWSFHDMTLSSWVDNAFQALAVDERRKPFRPSVWERSPNAKDQVLEQVWFAGVHSNVGGSYAEAGLSDITLLWMAAKAEGCGLAIDRSALATVNNPRPDPYAKIYDSQTIWYKLTGLGDYVRPIGEKTDEFVASTVLDRAHSPNSNYQPPNIEKFVASGGKVCPVPLEADPSRALLTPL